MERIYRRLLDEKITLSLRRDRTGRSFLRVSPHFYNRGSEVERLLEALSR
jgi:selenocysteine lyase/cysteine desulfurase